MVILVTCMILLLVLYFMWLVTYKYLAIYETELTLYFCLKKKETPLFDDYALY